MSFEPYLRAAGDGTLELLVPSTGGIVHILPYCFHSEEDAANWLASRKGRELMTKLCRQPGKRPKLKLIVRGRVVSGKGPATPAYPAAPSAQAPAHAVPELAPRTAP